MRTLIMLSAIIFMQYGAFGAVVPTTVENSFKSKYPTAAEVEWNELEEGQYEAYFTMNDVSKTAKFEANGSWVETRTFMLDSELPALITNAIATSLEGSSISGATMVESQAGNTYEVSAEAGDKSYVLTYTHKGELVKKLEETYDSDNDSDDSSDDGDLEEE